MGAVWLAWNVAAVLAPVLAVAAAFGLRATAHWVRVLSAFARETAIILALYAVWQRAGQLSVMRVTGALSRGRAIWHAERVLRLPSELSVQHLALHSSLFIQACNVYYAVVHVPALGVFLVWLFVRHRDEYPSIRNTIAVLTGVCLAIQLIPVAPPRLLHGLGFVDTALVYKQSVYTALGSGAADQLSAMPSVHVGWAVVVGVGAVMVSRSRWRWLALAHPILTTLVVVVTANHFWLDGAVAVVILAAAWAGERGRLAAMAWFRQRRSAVIFPVPEVAVAVAEVGVAVGDVRSGVGTG